MKRSNILSEYGALVALLLLSVITAARHPEFLHIENLRNQVSQSAVEGIIAIGMTIVIIAGGIDLSVGSMTAMCGATAVLLVNKAASAGMGSAGIIAVATLGAVAVGLVAGFFNGIVIAYGRVAAFVVTLAGLAGFRSIALVLGQGGEIRSNVTSFGDFGYAGIPIPFTRDPVGRPLMFYWSAVIFIMIALIFGFILNRTRFGRYVVAVGANRRAAEYSGIDTRTVILATYAILGALVGIASMLVAARMNSVGSGSVGLYYELDAIAAVVIGGTSLRGGRGRIWGTVVGMLLMTLIQYMITAENIDTNWQGVVRGIVILVAVLMQRRGKESE